MRVSGAEAPGVALGILMADVIEMAAFGGRARELERLALERGVRLASLGCCASARDHLALGVRPDRWLLLFAPGAPGSAASVWQGACSGAGVAVDLSSALAACHLTGPAARAVLARGCRLDLHAEAFPAGRAAATVIAQVSVTLAALPAGWLLLSPASTARHLHDWLASVAKPFGLITKPESTVEIVFEEHPPLRAAPGGEDS
jgi:heterotetrameric sarcosine oxidase gamma subunit